KGFRQKVQMIFQDPYQSLNPQVSIFDAVCEPLVIHRIGDSTSRREMVGEMLAMVGLSPPEDFLARYPHQLSGGQRQRVAIARAMILRPTIVVADEPTSMLDASISAQIFNILLDMREKFQVTILFITHSLAAARYLCDRLGVIYKGSLMELGPSDLIISDPRHPYTQALIDALPKFGQCGSVLTYNTLLPNERKGVGDETEGGRREFCPFFPRCRLARPEKCGYIMPTLETLSKGREIRCFFPSGLRDGKETAESSQCYYGV
ncbi:MAG TPA: ATP-binding cassette domain-containing protein, partial [Armatimonadetes bacterium]|nr:ATP-binding cassette domain-containing protein [Armatimonadota bacterium]